MTFIWLYPIDMDKLRLPMIYLLCIKDSFLIDTASSDIPKDPVTRPFADS